jgi:hypothetical protein
MTGNVPGVPDYQAANTQDVTSNRPTISTPWGKLDWTRTPGVAPEMDADAQKQYNDILNAMGPDKGQPGADRFKQQWLDAHKPPDTWAGNVTLNPEQQAALDAQQKLQRGQSDLALSLQGGVSNALQHPFDFGSAPAMPDYRGAMQNAIDANYKQATSRLDPQFDQRQGALRSQLYNQGLKEGDQAYDTAMNNFGLSRNDAYSSAMNNAIGQGNQTAQTAFGIGLQGRQQALNEGIQQQMLPLNELQAVLSGNQVQMPGFGVPGAQSGSNALGAAQMGYQGDLNRYGASQAQQQGLMSGFAGLAALPFGF